MAASDAGCEGDESDEDEGGDVDDGVGGDDDGSNLDLDADDDGAASGVTDAGSIRTLASSAPSVTEAEALAGPSSAAEADATVPPSSATEAHPAAAPSSPTEADAGTA